MTSLPTAHSHAGPSRVERGLLGLGLAAVLAVIGLNVAGADEVLIFIVSAVTLTLMAFLLGEATDQLGEVIGGRIAGLLNATLGNLPELVVVLLLIHEAKEHPELIDVAKASLIGSVLGNVLFVLGLAFLLGGLRHGTQVFRRTFASLNASMLVLAVAALSVPALINARPSLEAGDHIESISIALAGVLLFVYLASLRYFLRDSDAEHAPAAPHAASWAPKFSLAVLAGSAIGVGVVSEALVGVMEPTIRAVGISESFMGFILVPVVGNIAEHLVAVQLAMRNRMDFAVTIALGSSVQVALFIVPAALLLSYVVGNPIDLVFDPLQLLALTLAALIVPALVNDGESTWIEGLMLVALYALIAIGFWY